MMRTPATLVALSLLALGAPGSSYAADAPATCLGQTATIVAANEEQVTGTNGPDVIVVTGYSDVDALNGDDLVCIRESECTRLRRPWRRRGQLQDLPADRTGPTSSSVRARIVPWGRGAATPWTPAEPNERRRRC